MRRPGALSSARLPIILLTALWSAGCFKYTRIEPAAAPRDEELRVQVTRDAAVRVGPQLGTLSERLEGRLEPLGSDSVILAVWIGKNYIGTDFEDTRQRVSLTPSEIVEVRRRVLDKPRTILAAIGVIAATALVVNTISQEGDPNPIDPGGPYQPPVEFRVPLFRLGW